MAGSALHGLWNMARGTGGDITPETAKPFLDLEHDRNRMMKARMLAGPAGAAAVHMAPIVPHGGEMQTISHAVPEMAGMGINAPLGEGASMGAEMMNNLGPVMAMGSLGIGGSVLAAYLASKMYGGAKGLLKRRALKKTGQDSILEVAENEEQAMLRNIRFTKFATAGALGTPADLVGVVKTAAFGYGFFREVLAQRADLKLGATDDELATIDELQSSIKLASAIAADLNAETEQVIKLAGEIVFTSEILFKSAMADSADPNDILNSSRSTEQVKTASVKLSAVSEVMNAGEYGIMSKMAKSLDMLGVSAEVAAHVANGNPSGLIMGTLGLLAAA